MWQLREHPDYITLRYLITGIYAKSGQKLEEGKYFKLQSLLSWESGQRTCIEVQFNWRPHGQFFIVQCVMSGFCLIVKQADCKQEGWTIDQV